MAYYADEAIDVLLLVGVIGELFSHTVRSKSAWSPHARTYLVSGVAVGISIDGLMVLWLRNASLTRSDVWDNLIDVFTSLLLCTLLLISGWMSVGLRLNRTAKVLAIGRGIAFWAGIALLVDICHMDASWVQSPVFDEIVNATWVAMILYWTYTLWKPDPSGRGTALPSI